MYCFEVAIAISMQEKPFGCIKYGRVNRTATSSHEQQCQDSLFVDLTALFDWSILYWINVLYAFVTTIAEKNTAGT